MKNSSVGFADVVNHLAIRRLLETGRSPEPMGGSAESRCSPIPRRVASRAPSSSTPRAAGTTTTAGAKGAVDDDRPRRNRDLLQGRRELPHAGDGVLAHGGDQQQAGGVAAQPLPIALEPGEHVREHAFDQHEEVGQLEQHPGAADARQSADHPRAAARHQAQHAVLTQRERKGLKGTKAGELFSSSDYAQRATVSLRTAATELTSLEARGLVVRSGVGRATRWRRT